MMNRCCPAAASATPGGCLAFGAMLVCLVLQGCASMDTAREAPLELSVTLNHLQYHIGDPVVATVRLSNVSPHTVIVPRLDEATLEFMTGGRGMKTRVHRTPVVSDQVVPEPRELGRGTATSRRFLFTRATARHGEFALMAAFKGAFSDGDVLPDTIYAQPVPFTVTQEVALKRDPANGHVLKSQALELARRTAKGEVHDAQAILVHLENSGLVTWVVTLRVTQPDGKERRYAVQVDPYVGRVRRLELVDPEREQPRLQQANGRTRVYRAGPVDDVLAK